MDSRNIPREIFHISLGATSCVPQEDGPSGYVEYFTRDVSLVHYRAILHSAAPRVILPINNCKLSLDATRLVTIYSCLSMVMVFYFEVVCICRSIFYKKCFCIKSSYLINKKSIHTSFKALSIRKQIFIFYLTYNTL